MKEFLATVGSQTQLSPEAGVRLKDVNHPSGVLVHIWRAAERPELKMGQSLVPTLCTAGDFELSARGWDRKVANVRVLCRRQV